MKEETMHKITAYYMANSVYLAEENERLKKALTLIANMKGAGLSNIDMFYDAQEIAKSALDPDYKPVLIGRYNNDN